MLKNRIQNHFYYLYYRYLVKTNPLIKSQRRKPLTIPILIINFNQLFYLRQLVNFLITRGFENIIIIDNNSTYPPLLDYYKGIQKKVTIEFNKKNEGHTVFLKNKWIQEKYGKGYYVITDADIVPNNDLPKDFMNIMINYLDKYFKAINKIGFALKIDDLPNAFPLKEKVLNWEQQFWELEIDNNVYKADLDTTFSLYKPSYPSKFNNKGFVQGIRLAGDFLALHGGWYIDPNNMSEENIYYYEHSSNSSSWKFTEKGEVQEDFKNIY